MSPEMSSVPDLATKQEPILERPTTEFLPTLWGDYFLSQATPSMGGVSSISKELEGLKEEIMAMLKEEDEAYRSKTLRIVDDIQRLGVAYHFNGEIEAALNKLTQATNDDNLLSTALWFRLLRQQGIKVSCGVFEKFKDLNGNFKTSLADDVAGMLSLYEAAHLAIRGEEILDEALEYSTRNLKKALPHLSPSLAKQVSYSLKWPLRYSITRIHASHYMDLLSQLDESHNRALLKFSKLDFNNLQLLHQKELRAMTEWWKSLDVPKNLPYARDRLVEGYFWMLQVYFEPQYSVGRMMLTKIIQLLSLLDDTYDNYGVLEELETFTQAIHRWDIEVIDVLPEYMKVVYRALIDVYSEIEDLVKKEERSYCMYYAKQVMKIQVQAYLDEAKWRDQGYVPNFEEYMSVSTPSGGLGCLATSSYLGMGEIASEESFQWILSNPKILTAMASSGRLQDDMTSHELERKRRHVASAVECYMNQYKVSKEQTIKFIREEIRNAWKNINEECLKPTPLPIPLIDRILNLAKGTDAFYKDGDGYTDNRLVKRHIVSLLKDPVPI